MEGVSVIICCYNSRSRILPTLQHLAGQTARIGWELIVVDNNSTDNIADFVKQEWGSTIPLKVIKELQPGLKFAREAGIRAASSDLIIFCDDDNRLAPDYLQKVYNIFSGDRSIAMIGGIGKAIADVELPSWFAAHENLFAVGRPVAQSGPLPLGMGYVYGAGMALRKSAWVELEGYGFRGRSVDRRGTELSGGHDVEMGHALRLIGYKVVFDDSLKFGHYMEQKRLSWPYVLSLARGSSSNFISLVYFIYFQRGARSSLDFTYLYLKRVVSDLLQILRSKKDDVMLTTTQASFKFLLVNFFGALAYFNHIKRIKSISERK